MQLLIILIGCVAAARLAYYFVILMRGDRQ